MENRGLSAEDRTQTSRLLGLGAGCFLGVKTGGFPAGSSAAMRRRSRGRVEAETLREEQREGRMLVGAALCLSL